MIIEQWWDEYDTHGGLGLIACIGEAERRYREKCIGLLKDHIARLDKELLKEEPGSQARFAMTCQIMELDHCIEEMGRLKLTQVSDFI